MTDHASPADLSDASLGGTDWRRPVTQLALGLAVALLGSALVCAVAANWPALPVWARLAGAQAIVVLCVLAALALGRRDGADPPRPAQVAALVLAGIALGALLALIGQTYQTGADTWQLFAWWAVLLVPWGLAGGAAPWMLCLLVGNVALMFGLAELTPLAWMTVFDTPLGGMVTGACNLIALAVWEIMVMRGATRAKWGVRVLAALTLASLSFSVMISPLRLDLLHVVFVWLLISLSFWFYRVRTDRVVLAMVAAAFMAVSLRWAGDWLFDGMDGLVALPIMAGLILTEAWLVTRLLLAGRDKTPARTEAAPPPSVATDGSPPWYVQVLLAGAAWLAAVMLLVTTAFLHGLDDPRDLLWPGLLLTFAGAGAARLARLPVFPRQLAVAVSLAGLGMANVAIMESATADVKAWAMCFGLAAALYAVGAERVLRLLAGVTMGIAVVGGTLAAHGHADIFLQILFSPAGDVFQTSLMPTTLLAWGAVIAFLATQAGPAARQRWTPLAWAWALVAQVGVWFAGGVPLTGWLALWSLYTPAALAMAATVLLPVFCMAWASTPGQLRQASDAAPPGHGWRLGACAGVLALALLWMPSPGVAFALSWLLLGQALRRPLLTGLGVLGGLAYLLRYYYQLQVPLLDKSLWLALAGGVALVLYVIAAWATKAAQRRAAGAAPAQQTLPARSPAWRLAVITLGLAAALGVANTSVWRNERILAQGQVLRLALAPVDPRSLMQGDYMALNFEVADQLRQLRPPGAPADAPVVEVPADGYLVLRHDEQGVARLQRVQGGPQPRAQDEIALRYRKRAGQVHIVTNAYFFAEGQAERYEAARFGEFRVNDGGTGLLLRLLDAEGKPL
ncbi:putative membrane protein [plant metagenome]|uniref:Putative membrane protein n=1 Tax=plant metagenome TaxID=1297885 RepID=A0A484R673_9ZZZZ